MDAAYCRSACGATVCADCPRPRVLPDALFAIDAFDAVSTQWQIGPTGRLLGLRYEGCAPALRMRRQQWRAMGLSPPSAAVVFEDVQVIELAQMQVMAAKAAEGG